MIGKKIIKVLVVDDSLFMRQIIVDFLNKDSRIEVVGTATSGEEGVELVTSLKPDVVTLDYNMPGLNGIATLKKIMRIHPTPVIMISAYTRDGGDITFEALSEGAFDYVLKPSGSLSLDIAEIGEIIINKIKIASTVSPQTLIMFAEKKYESLSIPTISLQMPYAITIGSSTGGTTGVEMILKQLPGTIPSPIFIVQHMQELFTKVFATRLNSISKITVKEAENGEVVQNGIAYIAPGNWHMEVETQTLESKQSAHQVIKLSKKSEVHGLRPSVDVLFSSVAKTYASHAIGVILSGMGVDGANGIEILKEAGATTIAQNKESSVIFGMPCAAIETGAIDDVLSIELIPTKIVNLVNSHYKSVCAT